MAALTALALLSACFPVGAAIAGKHPKPRPCTKAMKPTLPLQPPSTTTTTVPCRATASLSKSDARGNWKGSLDVDSMSTTPGNSCTASWSGDITVTVRANGTVVGRADATTAGPSCARGFVGRGATSASLMVTGAFTGDGFNLRFRATSINGFESGFHLLYLPGPPTIRVPLLKLKKLKKPFADGSFGLFNAGPEECRGGGCTATADGLVLLKEQ
jgi:hypothetical protein